MSYRNTPKHRYPGSSSKRRRRGVLAAAMYWLLIGIVGFVVGRFALAFGDNVLMLAREARKHRQEIAALRQETEWLREQNAALRQEAQRLNTRSGIILEARKQGYGFPGEKLLVIQQPPASSTTP
jgi:cell division protein FtsB